MVDDSSDKPKRLNKAFASSSLKEAFLTNLLKKPRILDLERAPYFSLSM